MRVATYNVHMLTGDPSSGERPDAWPGQQEATAEALESAQCAEHFAAAFARMGVGGSCPDIIGLQEGASVISSFFLMISPSYGIVLILNLIFSKVIFQPVSQKIVQAFLLF